MAFARGKKKRIQKLNKYQHFKYMLYSSVLYTGLWLGNTAAAVAFCILAQGYHNLTTLISYI